MKRTATPTSAYTAFKTAIAACPYDAGAWSMFIDWLTEQDRLREACIARIALAQRQKFGPLTPHDFAHDGRFDQQRLISRFVWHCRSILYHGASRWERDGFAPDRERRFRSRCKFEIRKSPKSGFWEYRVVGPDPNVYPLDCPPDDERRRFTQWKAYPDKWLCIWCINPAEGWVPLIRYPIRQGGSVPGCYRHAQDVSRLHSTVCVVRDQDGRYEAVYQGGIYLVSAAPAELPENEFPDSPV